MIARIAYQLYDYITKTYTSMEALNDGLLGPLGISVRSVRVVDAALAIVDYCRYNRMTDRLIGALLKSDSEVKDQLKETLLNADPLIGVRIVADDQKLIQDLRNTAIKWGAHFDVRAWQPTGSEHDEENRERFHCTCHCYILVLHKQASAAAPAEEEYWREQVSGEYADAHFHGLSTYVLIGNGADYAGSDTILNLQRARWPIDTIIRYSDVQVLYSSFDQIVAGESNTYRLALGTLARDVPEQSVIISYAGKRRTDQVDTLRIFLEGLNLSVVLWDNQGSGASPEEMDEELKSAIAAVLLVSAAYVANKNVKEHQLPRISEARKKGGLKVIKLVVSPCNYDHLEEVRDAESYVDESLKHLRPIQREEIFAKVARDIASRYRSGREQTFTLEARQAIGEKEERIRKRLKERRERGQFDVFICYNSEDKSAVTEIATKLERFDVLPWLDAWEIAPGRRVRPVLEKGMAKCKCAAVFVGKSGEGFWQSEEMDVLLKLAVYTNKTVVPVLLADAPTQLGFIGSRKYVQFLTNSDDDALKELIWAITGKRPHE